MVLAWLEEHFMPFENPEMILPLWDTWGRSNQQTLFFHSNKGCLFFNLLERFVENPGEFPLPPLVSLATLGW